MYKFKDFIIVQKDEDTFVAKATGKTRPATMAEVVNRICGCPTNRRFITTPKDQILARKLLSVNV